MGVIKSNYVNPSSDLEDSSIIDFYINSIKQAKIVVEVATTVLKSNLWFTFADFSINSISVPMLSYECTIDY